MVSVIVPVYNGERYLSDLFRQLNAQNYHDFEVIFINDGSKDNTLQTLQTMGASCSFPVIIHSQDNAGVSAARNAGLQMARGEYICFVDADDMIAPDYLSMLTRAAQETGCPVVLGYMTRKLQEFQEPHSYSATTLEKNEILRDLLYRGNKYTICSAIYAKNQLTDHNLLFYEGYKYSEDVHLLWRLLARQTTVGVVPVPIYYYQSNAASAMNRMDMNRMDAVLLMQDLEPYMDQYAPEFAPEFKKFCVSRHHWSILWQAAIHLKPYRAFTDYCCNFQMKEELEKLDDYPGMKIRWSSKLYRACPRMYYCVVREYLKLVR